MSDLARAGRSRIAFAWAATARRQTARLVVFIAVLAVISRVSPTVAAQPQPVTVLVEMREFAFQPQVIRVLAGRPVRLRLINRGQIAHQLEAEYLRGLAARVIDDTVRVEAPGIEFIRLQPGGQARAEFVPRRRGRFSFACTIEGHAEAGMRGILEVR